MKSVSCMIWILAALLAIATLDARPDPPGVVNPGADRGNVLQVHDWSCATPMRRFDCLDTASSSPSSLVAADAFEPYRPSDRMLQAGLAADPSPPALHAGRKQFFQS